MTPPYENSKLNCNLHSFKSLKGQLPRQLTFLFYLFSQRIAHSA